MGITLIVVALLSANALLCRAQSATYKRYDDYSVADFDTKPGFPVPAVADCLAMSTASPQSDGAVYNNVSKTCKLVMFYDNEILIKLKRNVGWVTYVKDISARWRLVYKAQAAQSASQSVANAFTGGGGSYSPTYSTDVASNLVSSSCKCTYRNDFIDYWNVTQVAYQFFKDGLPVAWTAYEAKGQSSTDWFVQKNLIGAAPYSLSQMRLLTMRSFVYRVLVDEINSRDFAIWASSGGCSADSYYMMATNELASTNCSYSSSPYPTLIYSATINDSIANSPGSLNADFLMISVKTDSRVVYVP